MIIDWLKWLVNDHTKKLRLQNEVQYFSKVYVL